MRNGLTVDYRLVGLPIAILYNRANSDLDPTEGYRIDLNVTPWVYSRDFFTVMRLTGRSYFDLGEPGRSVLATRASFGTEPAISIGGIPPDKLFYAGGGGSVRGFVYQSAGPRDAFNNPLGGASVVEASVELRQRIGKSWGAVAFVDAGSAYPDMISRFLAVRAARRRRRRRALLHRLRSGAARCRHAAQPALGRSRLRHLCQPGPGLLMRVLRFFALGIGSLLALVVLAFAVLQTAPGQRAAASLISSASSGPDGGLDVVGLSGFFPADLHIGTSSIVTARGRG